MNGLRFDFGDGKGPVPAHQHGNGGGWVADSAVVDNNCWVGPRAVVYGTAEVMEGARIRDTVRIYGNASVQRSIVRDQAQVYGDAVVQGGHLRGRARAHKRHHLLTCEGLTYSITVTPQNIAIGCQVKSHKQWLKITKAQARNMDLPPDEYPLVKSFVMMAIKRVTAKKGRR